MNSTDRPRNPVAAALLSLLLPGLGELYAGKPRAAAVTFAGYYIIAALGVALIFLPFRGAAAELPLVIILLAWVLVVVRAARAATRALRPYALQSYNRWYWYLVAILISGFVWQPIVFNLLTTRWIRAFRVPSDAMAPTILSGDFIFVSKLPDDRVPARNDIVVVSTPTAPSALVIKRVVGVPGDTLGMKNGVLTRNRASFIEPFVQQIDSASAVAQGLHEGREWQLPHLVGTGAHSYQPNMRNWGPLVVPNDSVFLLGDNRDNSFDSRFWGAVGTDRLRGRPLVVYFSVSKDGSGDSAVRWYRIGHRF